MASIDDLPGSGVYDDGKGKDGKGNSNEQVKGGGGVNEQVKGGSELQEVATQGFGW